MRFPAVSTMNGGDGFYSPVEEEEGEDDVDMRRAPRAPSHSPMMSLQYEHAQQQHHLVMVRRQMQQEVMAAGGDRGGPGGASRSLNLLLESEKVRTD